MADLTTYPALYPAMYGVIGAPVAKRWNGTSWDVVSVSAVPDAIAMQVISNLTVFQNWLAANGAQGIVGEIGWANDHYHPGDSAKWNATAHLVLSYLDAIGMDWLFWAGDNSQTSAGGIPNYVLGIYATGATAGGNLAYTGTQAAVASYHYPLGTYRRGVNAHDANANSETNVDGVASPLPVSGGTFNSMNPGTVGSDYWYPSNNDFAFYAAQRVKMICVRFRWERLQPTLGGALSATEVSAIQSMLTSAAGHGIKVALEPHNGHGYILGTSPSAYQTYKVSQAGTVTVANFVNMWTRLSTALAGYSALAAYGLVNEPAYPSCGIPSGSNLVTNGSFASNITGWSPNNSAVTLAWVSSPAFPGTTGSMQMTATALASGTNVPSATTGYVISVTGGSSYQAECWFLAGSAALREFCRIQVNWHDASGSFLGSSVGDVSTFDSDVQWQYASSAVTAPATATAAAVLPFFPGTTNGEVHYVSSVSLRACTSPMTGVGLWQYASQQVVTALRGQGDNTEVWVESARNTGPQQIPQWNAAAWITDTANATRYDCHLYFDYNDGGGIYTDTYAAELAAAIAAGY